MPDILAGDFETIRQPIDFYGLSFYNGLMDNTDKERAQRRTAGGGNYQNIGM